VWWYTPVIPKLRRQRQEDHKVEVLAWADETLSPKKKKSHVGRPGESLPLFIFPDSICCVA
jgi:hypothetical protein